MSRIHEAIRKAQKESKAAAPPRQNLAEIGKELVKEFAESRPVAPVFGGAAAGLARAVYRAREQESSGSLPEFEGFPSLAISPHSKVAMISGVGSAASEQYDRLSDRLEHWEEGNLRTVVVAGNRGGEGATVTATNLSLALAKDATRKVLLVDANTGHPGIGALLGFSNRVHGLSEFLAEKIPLTGVVHRTEIFNFCVTPSGALLGSEQEPPTGRVEDFLHQVSERFDWVIIDSPAVSCAQFEVLGNVVDGVLLVVKAMETTSKEVSASLTKLKNAKLLGFVLNEAGNLRRSRSFF